MNKTQTPAWNVLNIAMNILKNKITNVFYLSDPYVKVSLMCHGRRIKKKKTSVKKCTLNPVYNEAIVFDVPSENIKDVSLIIKVIDYDRYHLISLKLLSK